MNQGVIDGRLGADPELYTPANGSEYRCLTFNICNDEESRKNQHTGEYENIPSWFTVKYWTKKPQHWLNQLVKGAKVVVSVTMKQETWEKDGQKQSKVVFNVARGTFPLVIPKRENAQSQPQQNQDPFQQPIDEDSPF